MPKTFNAAARTTCGDSIARDFQLMELVSQMSVAAVGDGVDPFVLPQSGHEMTVIDLASHADMQGGPEYQCGQSQRIASVDSGS